MRTDVVEDSSALLPHGMPVLPVCCPSETSAQGNASENTDSIKITLLSFANRLNMGIVTEK